MNRLLGSLKRMSSGGVAGLIAVLIVAGVVLFFSAAHWVNTSPSRCATCHPALTAMWQRSHGHPAKQVGCYQCHAAHAEPPASLNVGAVIRDQWIPEKYLSSDARVESRCEGCHGDIRTVGTGMDLIEAKEQVKRATNRLSDSPMEKVELVLPALPVRSGGEMGGRDLLGAAVRWLRSAEWRAAFEGIPSDGVSPTIAGLREPLEFSGQSLSWVRISEAKVRAGVEARVRSKLTLYKGEMVRVRRGVRELAELLAGVPPDAALADAEAMKSARAVLEDVSRGLRGADRARAAVLRELEGMEASIFDPDALAKALRVVPKALKGDQLDAARDALLTAGSLLDGAAWEIEQTAIDARVERRVSELTSVLQAKLAGLKKAFAAVLADLPADDAPQATSGIELVGASMVMRAEKAPAPPAEVPVDPRMLVENAATAIRSLEVSLTVASNLGWSDFSLRESYMRLLAEQFEGLAEAFAAQEGVLPDGPAVRRSLEQAVVSLAAGEAADGLSLAYRVSGPGGDSPMVVSLSSLLERAAEAMADLETTLEKRKVVKVNHKVHFQLRTDASGRDVDLGCLDCHRNIAHDKARLETFRPRMASCFVGDCHRKDRNKDNCRRCHYQQLQELAAQAN